MGEARPTYLRCEYHVDPLGIGETGPRLSWEIADARRGVRQTAYQVLVASTEEALAAGRGDRWDSGRVASDRTCHVVYAGEPLGSRQECWWKVRLWLTTSPPGAPQPGEATGWSEPARWTMGLLDAADWQAEWVGYDVGAVPLLRRAFRVEKPVRRATVYATALGEYELSLNGGRVGDARFTPGWTEYRKRLYYQSSDVTGLIRGGENVLGAMLAPGWYAGHMGLRWPHFYGSALRLRAQLEIDYADGTREVVPTDRSWRALGGPILSSDHWMGETYDARRERPGWDAPGYRARGWRRVATGGGTDVPLEPHPGAAVRTFEEMHPVAVTEPGPGVWLFDLGQEFAGWARLRVRGERGTRIVLRFGEVLEPDGTLHTANLRAAKCTDTYVLRGGGETEVWGPRFTFRGFRYVEVRGFPGRPGPEAVTGVVAKADTPPAGRFECSDAMLNRLWSNILWTQRANFLEVPTDCPQRDERLGWTGDAQIFMPAAAWNMDVAAFLTKWLVDLADAQRPDGAFPDQAPDVGVGDASAAYGDAGVTCPWLMYRVYGDRRALEAHYEGMVRWIEHCRTHSRGLVRPAEGYGDWVNLGAPTPKALVATAWFAHSTDLVARAARVLGKVADAERFEGLFGEVREAFNRAYVSEDGRVEGDTQAAYALALAFDLLPEAVRPKAAERLVGDIQRRGGHLTTGFIGSQVVLDALAETGHLDVAYALLTRTAFPSWGFCVEHGATTVWERWDAVGRDGELHDPEMNSYCHFAFGSVGAFLYRTVAGIRAAEPGFERTVIRPRPGGGTTSAKASYRSIRGTVEVAWELERDRFRLDLTVPPNTSAAVHVPARDASEVTEGGRPPTDAAGVRLVRAKDGEAVFDVPAGTYRFASSGRFEPRT